MKFDYLPITSVATIISGGTPKTSMSEYWNGNIPWLSVKDFNNGSKFVYSTEKHITELGLKNSSTNLLRVNDIIISARGTVGEMAMIPFNMAFNQSCFGIRANIEKILPDYLYYALKNNIQTIKSSTHGSVFDTITLKDFEVIKIPVPDLETQKKIVRILSALDQKIELNNRLIDLLYSLGDAIYEKIQNDNPRTVTLKDISINYDKKRVPLSSRQREERRGKIPYYGATSILDYVDDYLFDGEYVLLGEDGTVMTNEGGAVLQYIWGKNWVNNHAHVLQGSKVSTEYLLFALRSVNVSALVTGAVQPKINQENMNKIKLSICSEDKMSEVEESIKTIAAQIRNLTDGNKSLSDMRNTLLPKLMSGEVNLDKVTLQ